MELRLKTHFLSLYCMVVADLDVSPSELEELYRIGKEYYNLKDSEINQAIISGGSAFYNPDSIEDKVKYLYELALIACADGKIEPEERILLEKYTLKFGFLEENIGTIVDLLIEKAKKKEHPDNIIKSINL